MKKRVLAALVTAAGISLSLSLALPAMAEETDKKVLSIATGGELDTSMSQLLMQPYSLTAKKLIYETLLVWKDGAYEPCLAESYEWNDDQTALTFHLRQGVTFHDGEPFNAEAVKQNMEYRQANELFAWQLGVSRIASIDVVDDYTITFNYEVPYLGTIDDIIYPDVCSMISPKTLSEDYVITEFVGTGPYVYSEFVKGEYTLFEKNENYWGEELPFDQVIAKYIPDSGSRLKALENGEVDLIYGSSLLTYDDYEQALSIPGIAGQIPDLDEKTRNIVANAGSELLSDVRVRQAVAMSIDKEAIAAGLTYGHEKVAENLYPLGENIPVIDDVEMENQWTYDPEAAKALLDEAGWVMNEDTGIREKDGKPLSLVFTYANESILNADMATAVKSQLLEVGIDVTTSGLEQMLWWQTDAMGEFDLSIWDTNARVFEPVGYFNTYQISTAASASMSALPDVDELLDHVSRMQATVDDAELHEIIGFILNYTNNNVVDIPIMYTKEPIVYNTAVVKEYDFFDETEYFDIFGITAAE
ncbi:MAG: nickel ABC transporter substrate-binding protein [Blautia sp.]|nr:nickel ABC transporter substrate-binding protein [Blautia sp.]